MKVAVTGGTGFVGGALAAALLAAGHEVVLIARGKDPRGATTFGHPAVSFSQVNITDERALVRAFAGCAAVAHCAGINREIGNQTYDRIHIQGTTSVVNAARAAGVEKIVLLSFLRARPNCKIAYHETKWAAEEIVRASGLDYTIVKAGIIYGPGDHLLSHLSEAVSALPVFGLVGMGAEKDRLIAPVAVEDIAEILSAALVRRELSRQTVAAVGPEPLTLREIVTRVGSACGRRPLFIRLPVFVQLALAWLCERFMRIPLVAVAQVRILSEGAAAPMSEGERLPSHLAPNQAFVPEQIRKGLPAPKHEDRT